MPRRTLLAELLAEFFGTMVLLMIGNGVVAMVVLFGTNIPGQVVNGGYTNITLAWGIAVTMGIYIANGVSGAHLNPAVTIALAAFRGFPWKKVIPYFFAQVLGGFAGAAVVFFNYRAQFDKVDPLRDHTASVFTTFPAFPSLVSVGFVDQVIGTAILLICIMAIGDERNSGPSPRLAPILVGLSVVGIGMSFGGLHGYAINPARDLGPRLLTVVAGFSHNGLTDGSNQFIVPIVGPIAGGLIGTLLYDQLIGRWLRPAGPATTA